MFWRKGEDLIKSLVRKYGTDVHAEEGVSKFANLTHTRRCVRMVKMQGAEDEGAGSVLKYMTKPEDDSNAADWPL